MTGADKKRHFEGMFSCMEDGSESAMILVSFGNRPIIGIFTSLFRLELCLS